MYIVFTQMSSPKGIKRISVYKDRLLEGERESERGKRRERAGRGQVNGYAKQWG